MDDQHRHRYWLERMAKRKTGYPIGTVAFYGPDASRASKVAVGIILSEREEDVATMKKWTSDESDVRTDSRITAEMLAFLALHKVQRVAMADRIIGCPHEEGIDYPKGEACPQCPYWADRSRWTGELVR